MTAKPSILPVAGPLLSLFPPQSRGGLVLVEGPQDPPRGLFTLLGRGLLEGRRILYVDGAHTFHLYQLTALARIHGADPRQLLRQILLARAFTAPQLEALVARLAWGWERHQADLAVVTGLLFLAMDEAVPGSEAIPVFCRTLACLERLARRGAPLLVTAVPSLSGRRGPQLLHRLHRTVDRVVRLEAEGSRVRILEITEPPPAGCTAGR